MTMQGATLSKEWIVPGTRTSPSSEDALLKGGGPVSRSQGLG
jgi:hypothetical protein